MVVIGSLDHTAFPYFLNIIAICKARQRFCKRFLQSWPSAYFITSNKRNFTMRTQNANAGSNTASDKPRGSRLWAVAAVIVALAAATYGFNRYQAGLNANGAYGTATTGTTDTTGATGAGDTNTATR